MRAALTSVTASTSQSATMFAFGDRAASVKLPKPRLPTPITPMFSFRGWVPGDAAPVDAGLGGTAFDKDVEDKATSAVDARNVRRDKDKDMTISLIDAIETSLSTKNIARPPAARKTPSSLPIAMKSSGHH